MITKPDDFKKLFSLIKEGASSGGCTVVIFVAPDPDSVCACRILTTLLQSDFISYVVKPVCGYEYLLEAAAKIDDEVKSVIMLNCGSVIDVEGLMNIEEEEVNIFVIDSHRPFHVANIQSDNVYLLGTEGAPEKEKEPELPNDENEDDLNKPAKFSRRKKAINRIGGEDSDEDEPQTKETNYDSDDSEEEDDDEDMEDIEDFATSYNTCISMLLYYLAYELKKSSKELLWLGIVGFTDQIVHYKIAASRWKEEMRLWQEEVRRFNGRPGEDSRSNGGVTIEGCDEYRFMAYRHWNLYDSMYHSSFVASRLGIWKSSNSRNALKRMLAKMGLPLEQCSQPFTMMDMKIKRQLPQKLLKYARQFNLTGLAFPSFQLSSGYTKNLSAVDAVYSLSGLLESKSLSSGSQQDVDQWKTNFSDAYSSLSNTRNSWEYIQDGIHESIELQKAIVKQGGLLIENKHISFVGQFRYAWLTTTTCNPATLSFFTGSLGLTKLALFLQEVFDQMRKRSKPIVLGALNEKKETFLIVGISTSPTRNMFGHVFEKAAIDTGARIQLHTFDGSVVEIAQTDAKLFIEHLQYGLSAVQ